MRSAVIRVATCRAALNTSVIRGPPQSTIARSECHPPAFDAWTEGMRARRSRMMRESSALRATASGSSTAATGVAKRPRMLISMRAIFVFPGILVCLSCAPVSINEMSGPVPVTPHSARRQSWRTPSGDQSSRVMNNMDCRTNARAPATTPPKPSRAPFPPLGIGAAKGKNGSIIQELLRPPGIGGDP